ncbi:MAG TPA: hypothetical protein VNL77_22835 [Roseiflexaceae bacterium]|nr:hypothetical protein [Roseiflexaceae bacterium]
MRNRLRVLIAGAFALALSAIMTGPAYGQAYGTKFITSITYQNVGGAPASIRLQFFSERSGTAITKTLDPLAAGAGTSVFIGGLSELQSSFKGGAVMSSDQPIVATMVQIPQGGVIRNRPVSNGFGVNDGAADFLIATVLKNTFNANTQFSVQNVDSMGADLTVKFVSADAATLGQTIATLTETNLPPGSVVYYDAGALTQLGGAFNGSVTISAKRTGTQNPGKVVATAMELGITKKDASAFEGVAGGSNVVYMPSAICNAFNGQTTAYAVQNTNTSGDVNVTVNYLASPNGTGTNQSFSDSATIPAGAKASFNACAKLPPGYSGSATITATGGNIVAISKVFGAGLSTAAPGVGTGAQTLALPYVRFSQTQFASGARQRVFIAVQNVGDADLAAGQVTVTYYDKNGAVVGTHALGAIAKGAKLSSNPTLATPAATPASGATLGELGYYADNTFGASAVVRGPAGSRLVAVARVTSAGVGEDYNGIPVTQ